jgi:molybdopterin synthase sulfur carrier subunit
VIQVLFFASIREALGVSDLEMDAAGLATAADVAKSLAARADGAWHEVMGREDLLIAVNQTVVKADHQIEDGDEVAFFPPVTGG